MISFLSTFFHDFWVPFLLTTTAAWLYCLIIALIGKMRFWQVLSLFLVGIIVITCIFLPFNWSLSHTGATKEVSIFFFNLNIQWNDFINTFEDFLRNNHISNDWLWDAVILFLAFLEELAKLLLLILAIRKVLRGYIAIIMIVLIAIIFQKMTALHMPHTDMVIVGIAFIICFVIVFSLLSSPMRTESVSDYVWSIALVATWFAYAENIKYMIDISQDTISSDIILHNAILRSVFGYLSHILFSIVCVAFYARWRFAFLRVLDDSGRLSLSQKALGWKKFTAIATTRGFVTGVVVASILHGIYNVIITTDTVIPALMLIFWYLLLEIFVLRDLRNNTRYGHLEKYM